MSEETPPVPAALSPERLHSVSVNVIARVIGSLVVKRGLPVEATIEASLKAALGLLVATGATRLEAARLLHDFASGIEDAEEEPELRPN